MATTPDPRQILGALGARIRSMRKQRGLTMARAASAAGLSERFLSDVEAGRGNISVVKLEGLARALGSSAASLLDVPGPLRVALLGLRGAGKSTVGPLLARRIAAPFHELDALVERAAGLPLAELFAVHGEAYYRRIEREALARLLAQPGPFVVAVGGSLVTDPDTFALLASACTTVWLRAKPSEHMGRVAAQGDRRPMAARSDAMTELKSILAARAPLYARADHTVETSGATLERVTDRVASVIEPQGLPRRSPTPPRTS